MIFAFTAEQIRRAEAPLLARGVPLMAAAAFAIAVRARILLRTRGVRLSAARVVILVGSGNNGGDGLFTGAHLARWGARVDIVLMGSHAHDGGLAAARASGARIEHLGDIGAQARDEHRSGSAGGAGDSGPDPVPHPAAVAAVVDVVLGADLVIDAILGIGARGGLRPGAAKVVDALAAALGEHPGAPQGVPGAPGTPRTPRTPGPPKAGHCGTGPAVLAIDAPSGIGVDDGSVPGPVLRADLTLGCGALAAGLLLPPASTFSAVIEMLDLVAPKAAAGQMQRDAAAVRRLEDADAARLIRVPEPNDDKYSRGVVGVVAGTPMYPGAAVLTVAAAINSGAGMVRYMGPDSVVAAVLARSPEAVHGPGRVQSWVVGPGVDPQDPEQPRRITDILANAGVGTSGYFSSGGVWGDSARVEPPCPIVVDAGALQFISGRCPPWVVLTPHAGELAALLNRLAPAGTGPITRADVEAAPLAHARDAHEATGATILLKGSTTLVVGQGGTYSQAEAPGWLATAGAGDVLAGLLGALLANRAADAIRDPDLVIRLAALAALIHGRAASAANPGGPLGASRLTEVLGPVLARLLASSP